MATSTVANSDYRNQPQDGSHKHFVNKSNCFAIDGPGSKLTSALQVVTEALSSTDNVLNQTSSSSNNQMPLSLIPSLTNNLQPAHTINPLKSISIRLPLDIGKDDQNLQVQGCPKSVLINQSTYSSESTSFECPPPDGTQGASHSPSITHLPSSDSIRTNNGGEIMHPQGSISTATGKTIVSPDSDVSNGFVKDGKMLPYVFEANEAGK